MMERGEEISVGASSLGRSCQGTKSKRDRVQVFVVASFKG